MTQPGEHVIANDVNIHGPLNLPSRMPTHASELYAKNLYNFLSPWIKDGSLQFDWSDEVLAGRAASTVPRPTGRAAVSCAGWCWCSAS